MNTTEQNKNTALHCRGSLVTAYFLGPEGRSASEVWVEMVTAVNGGLGGRQWPRKPSLLGTDEDHMPEALSSREAETKEKQKLDHLKTCQQSGKSQRSQKAT